MASFYPGVEHGMKKNHRKFPGIKGRRPDKKAARIAVAQANEEKRRASSKPTVVGKS